MAREYNIYKYDNKKYIYNRKKGHSRKFIWQLKYASLGATNWSDEWTAQRHRIHAQMWCSWYCIRVLCTFELCYNFLRNFGMSFRQCHAYIGVREREMRPMPSRDTHTQDYYWRMPNNKSKRCLVIFRRIFSRASHDSLSKQGIYYNYGRVIIIIMEP